MDNPIYQLIVKDKAGNIIGEITDWYNLKFSDKHNNYGECTFDVPVTSVQLLKLVSLRRYDLFILRNGQVKWSGEQANRSVTLEASSPELVTIQCFTFFEGLSSMFTDSYIRYDQVDQGAILKDLVDIFQAKTDGDRGYTFATIPETMPRDRDYSNYNLMDAYVNMSNVINGIDFWVDENKVIHIVPYRGIDKSKQIIFEFGVNIFNANIQEDFSSPANQAIVLGAGFGSSQLVGIYTDTSARHTYGLRQQRVSETDVSDSNTLVAKGQAVVRRLKSALVTIDYAQFPNTNPKFGSINIGDSVRIKIQRGIYNINNVFRIYGYNVEIGANGEEYIKYLVAQI